MIVQYSSKAYRNMNDNQKDKEGSCMNMIVTIRLLWWNYEIVFSFFGLNSELPSKLTSVLMLLF